MLNSEIDAARLDARAPLRRTLRRFTLTLLAIEFLDEIVDGTLRAAWPLLREDLALSYAEIGLLMSVPGFLSNLLFEPLIGILADIWRRRVLVLTGGIFVAAALMLVAASNNFAFLLVAFVLFCPAGGAFVNIAQVVLMDATPARREQNMVRWTFAGSLGNVAGPFALSLFVVAGAGWRGLFVAMALFALVLVAASWRAPFREPQEDIKEDERTTLLDGIRGALRELKRRAVVRWLVLLETSDLLERGLQTYLALYFVDVAGLTEAEAGLALVVWMGVGLVGDFLLIPLMERVRGLSYLRWSAGIVLCLLALFLLAPTVGLKLVLIALLGFTHAGWYAILKAQLYRIMPDRSGAVMTLGNVAGLTGDLTPLALGFVAQRFGLETMMWLLIASPLSLLLWLPRQRKGSLE